MQVIISLVDTTITAIVGKKSKIFGMLRVFRLVRALKPLRVINRAPGLKLGRLFIPYYIDPST